MGLIGAIKDEEASLFGAKSTKVAETVCGGNRRLQVCHGDLVVCHSTEAGVVLISVQAWGCDSDPGLKRVHARR